MAHAKPGGPARRDMSGACVELPVSDRRVAPAALEVRRVQPSARRIGEIEVAVAILAARQPDHPALPRYAGSARGIYVTAAERRVVVLHVFAKKSRKTPRRALATARERMKQVVL